MASISTNVQGIQPFFVNDFSMVGNGIELYIFGVGTFSIPSTNLQS